MYAIPGEITVCNVCAIPDKITVCNVYVIPGEIKVCNVHAILGEKDLAPSNQVSYQFARDTCRWQLIGPVSR